MFTKIIFTLSSLLLSSQAIRITSPSNTTRWTTSGSQSIEWTSVSTDPSNFTIQLILPYSPNDPETLAKTIKTDSGSYTYTPSSSLSAGDQYRVNFVADNGGILAQSDYFEVESGTSTASGSSSTSRMSSSTSSGSESRISTMTTTTAPAGAASVSESVSASASATGGASHLVVSGGLLAVVAFSVALLA